MSNTNISRKIIAANACWVMLLAGASLSPAGVRAPLGVYAHVDVETAINSYTGSSAPTAAQLHAYLRQIYMGLLTDPAVSGITAGIHWDLIQLSPPDCNAQDPNTCAPGTQSTDGYDYSYVEDVFVEAEAAQKSVQLILTPGVDSPSWLLAGIPSCDGLFTSAGTAPADCGKVTFTGFPEQPHADGNVLPLPLNSVYVSAWNNFLKHIDKVYGSNAAFVSIAIAGPNCASTEIILPTTANGSTQKQSGMPADQAWIALIAHSFPQTTSYQNSNQVFIDQWRKTIETYENTFANVTLFISPDSGDDLPALAPPPNNNKHFQAFLNDDCTPGSADFMSCQSKAEILWYFINVSGPNGKAAQIGGMTASSSMTIGAAGMGIAGVKVLTTPTSFSPPLSPAFLGGAEFDKAVSDPSTIQQEGCPDPKVGCPPYTVGVLTVEEAAYYVLTVFFNGTTAAAYYGGLSGPGAGVNGPALMQYVELDYPDIQYAQNNPCATLPSTIPGQPSLQDLLNMASYSLFGMAGQSTVLPPPSCPPAP